MKYAISYSNPLTHLIEVKVTLENISKPTTRLLLPIWRPGRYEAANYAKNIQKIAAYDTMGNELALKKVNPSEWSLDTKGVNGIEVRYYYFAFQMDAGSCWLDEHQLYLNFINCLIYDPDLINEECSVTLDIPSTYKIACGLDCVNGVLSAKNYYELVDSPLIASKNVQHLTYNIQNVTFHIWLQGENSLPYDKLVTDFGKFCELQIQTMGSFPEDDYHFLFQILPYKFYHGVEHGNSTVITLGPASEITSDHLYSELLGVSSHELFHAWNILKIRPKELLPYSFNEPVIFPTGFVAEGLTTYYGDLFLVKSGVFGIDWYFSELNKLFYRHFLNFGRLNHSVVHSSLDLWFDGYQLSAPNKKSSIYVEGAMSALLLDLTLRSWTSDEKSLDDLLRLLWSKFGQKSIGYSLEDIQQCAEEIAGQSLDDFFQKYVYGVVPKNEYLSKILDHVGCKLTLHMPENLIEKQFGIKLRSTNEDRFEIIIIEPGSEGEKHFSLKDELLEVNGVEIKDYNFELLAESYQFKVRRNYNEIEFSLPCNNYSFLNTYRIARLENPSTEQIESFKLWVGL